MEEKENKVPENVVSEKVATPSVEKSVVSNESKEAPKAEQSAPRRPRGDRQGGNRPSGPRHGDGRRGEREREVKEYEERVVAINRVSKTVKGGRRLKFSALVVIGDGKGKYGFGTGKAGEVPDAIKKALEAAKKNTFKIHIAKGDTITHEIIGKFGACHVFLRPAPEGTGIIAGGPVRAILELAGIKNVCSKVYGSRAPINIIRATSKGLGSLHTYSEVKALRGI